MIPRIKKHLPLTAIVLLSALATFSILWLRDAVRVVEPAAQASALSVDTTPLDPRIDHMLDVHDSIDSNSLESDIRELELATLGEELSDIETLLGNQ